MSGAALSATAMVVVALASLYYTRRVWIEARESRVGLDEGSGFPWPLAALTGIGFAGAVLVWLR